MKKSIIDFNKEIDVFDVEKLELFYLRIAEPDGTPDTDFPSKSNEYRN